MIRPADANEAAAAWKVAVASGGPTALILTRQNVPVLDGTSAGGVAAGGYAIREADGAALTLVGTGSEVSVCLAAADRLAGEGIPTRVVSLPSWDLFEESGVEYREQVLPPGLPSLAVEAGATLGWHRWVDDVVGIDRFGMSAPGATVLSEFGINPDNVAARAKALLES